MVESLNQGVLEIDLPTVNLYISCRDLTNMDYFSKSDPFVQVSFYTPNEEWQIVGKTEVKMDNINPDFERIIEISYSFSEMQYLRFTVLDYDENENSQSIGYAQCSLGEIMGSKQNQTKNISIFNEKKEETGKVLVRGELQAQKRGTDWVYLSCRAQNLTDKDTFSKSDPFFKFYKHSGQGENYDIIYTSEVKMDNLNPVWRTFRKSMVQICNDDKNRKLLIEVWDWDEKDSYEKIGSTFTTLNELLAKPQLKLVMNRKSQGTFIIQDVDIKHDYDFMDYLEGGLQFNFQLAIDFTQSNGEINKEGCLHNIKEGELNDYEKTINGVASVIQQYDNDKNFPVWGFGARPDPKGDISHCFALNGNNEDPCVTGIEELLNVYRQATQTVKFGGGTFFQDILKTSFKRAKQPWAEGEQLYYVLLILTDGIINDKIKVKDIIVEENNNPISIVIVGVGQEDFFQMEELDSDSMKLHHSKGGYAERDIIQFVDFKKFVKDPKVLSKQLLAEVPKQLESYMARNGIAPLKLAK